MQCNATPASRVAGCRKAVTLTTKLIIQGVNLLRAGQAKPSAALDTHVIDPHVITVLILSKIVLWRYPDKTREASGEKRA